MKEVLSYNGGLEDISVYMGLGLLSARGRFEKVFFLESVSYQ